jgi:hypothetical protein
LLYPSGFAYAAKHGIHPELPQRVLEIIEKNLCVTPRNTDLTNLIPLMSDYARVCLIDPFKAEQRGPSPQRIREGDFFCNETTMFSLIRGSARIRGRLNGGMIEIESEDTGRILLASAGYMVESTAAKGFTGVLDGTWTYKGHTLSFETWVQRTNRLRVTPVRSLVLRMYMVLCGNVMSLNLLVKKMIARRLMFQTSYLRVKYSRIVDVDKEMLTITDRFKNVSSAAAHISHCRFGFINFMGSARYFDASMLLHEERPQVLTKKNDGPVRKEELDSTWELGVGDRIEISHVIRLA